MPIPRLFRVTLPVADLDRAGRFWSELLGLEIDRRIPNRHYLPTEGAVLVLVDSVAHARSHGGETASFRPNPDWIYLRVPDLDAVWARAQALGCPSPTKAEGAGIARRAWGDRSFYTYDPAGNPICLIDDRGSDQPPFREKYVGSPVPALRNVVLPARSLGRSEGFFEELLEVEANTFVPNRHFFALEDCQLSLVDPQEHARQHDLPVQEFRPNPEIVYFAIDDLEAAFDRAGKLQMQATGDADVWPGIHTYPWGETSFYGLDPSGNPICLVDARNLYLGARGDAPVAGTSGGAA